MFPWPVLFSANTVGGQKAGLSATSSLSSSLSSAYHTCLRLLAPGFAEIIMSRRIIVGFSYQRSQTAAADHNKAQAQTPGTGD